ncbi:helix-hairpin-helix domain-containing protein [Shewanella sp. 202IG2-18]|uniref:ComEA family DNA-binding protein n=1 Tax=Parashewanella hymeniacidonis TaxID=2807618 RepID=UPI001962192E|nr:helix-hairpin-helix domain-containing protein [Parashewanella hymeniacidonis]MBM7074244.1 helix-hairpin-helix domain-containing protein [Parashewanella hymeniacidonis]
MKRTLTIGAIVLLFSGTVFAASNSNFPFEYQSTHKRPAEVNIKQININSALHSDLMNLHGIDSQKAHAIIRFRESNNGFQSFAELATVEGIGGKLVEINTYQLSL